MNSKFTSEMLSTCHVIFNYEIHIHGNFGKNIIKEQRIFNLLDEASSI
jgi:hypothetical protein